MSMAADSNMNFHNGVFPSSFCNQHVVSFQSGEINATNGVIQGGTGEISISTGTMRTGSPSILGYASATMLQGSGTGLFSESMAGLKHDTGLAVDWSYKEQAVLHHGLTKYSDQPSILKYIKIAALLPEKTVRDVALRCRWMNRKEGDKRRKLEEFYTGSKFKERKEILVSYSMENIHRLGDVAAHPCMMHLAKNNNHLLTESPVINDATRQLIEENTQLLNKIAANLGKFIAQDNVNLFLRIRNNITAILNSMSKMPGIMSQMPPLPAAMNEDLITTFLPNTSQAFMFKSPAGNFVKEEPNC